MYWFLRRPSVEGVKCVLTDGERVLLVRHAYGARAWELPGGAVRRGEEPVRTACREMREELGVAIDHWRALGELRLTVDHRRDRIHCFQAELPAPELSIDEAELVAAGWFCRHELPENLGRYVRPVLAKAGPVG